MIAPTQEIRHIGPVIWDIRSCLIRVFGTTGASFRDNRGKFSGQPGQVFGTTGTTGANFPGQTGANRGIFPGQTGASRKSSQGLVSRNQFICKQSPSLYRRYPIIPPFFASPESGGNGGGGGGSTVSAIP